MSESTEPPPRRVPPARGVRQADVSHAADALLRRGSRPTVEKIRATVGSGSPNTIGPLLDVWWKNLSARLDAGPAALHRLPETVAHIAEALWLQALEEGRRRAQIELKSARSATTEQQQTLEVRSHVLTLREGELDARLHDRERTITEMNSQLRELTLLLRKEQATREAQTRRIAALQEEFLMLQRPSARPPGTKRAAKGIAGVKRRRSAAARPKERSKPKMRKGNRKTRNPKPRHRR